MMVCLGGNILGARIYCFIHHGQEHRLFDTLNFEYSSSSLLQVFEQDRFKRLTDCSLSEMHRCPPSWKKANLRLFDQVPTGALVK